MSARRCVIIHQTSALVILLAETLLYYQQFLLVGCKVWFCPLAQSIPRYAIDTTLLIFERCALCHYIYRA